MGFWDKQSTKPAETCATDKPITQEQLDSLNDVARYPKTPAKPMTEREREAQQRSLVEPAPVSKTPSRPSTQAERDSLYEPAPKPSAKCQKLTPNEAKKILGNESDGTWLGKPKFQCTGHSNSDSCTPSQGRQKPPAIDNGRGF